MNRKYGILGCGNLGQAMLKALLDSGRVDAQDIFITNLRHEKTLRLAQEFGVRPCRTNEELIENSDVVVLAVKPQDLYSILEPLASSFHSNHVVLSLAAGVQLSSLQALIPETSHHVRVMLNTASKIKKSVVAYYASSSAQQHMSWLKTTLSSLGLVVALEDEEQMQAVVVGASSGVGFVFELMIYWKEWLEERGIDSETAKNITIQTFGGAAQLAENSSQTSLEELQRKVVSLKGVTAAGLDSIRELEIERALRYSFEKAALRDKELGEGWKKSSKGF